MTIQDRVGNVPEGLAFKAPCVAATTGNITLSGLQTIDGVGVLANQRVLVWQQTDPKQNGIYQASSGPWTRPHDASGNEAWTAGSQVYVQQGTVNAGITFIQTCLDDPVVIGTSQIAFAPAALLAVGQYNGTSATSQTVGTGQMSFVTQQGKLWKAGNWVQIASRSNTITTYMAGQVTAYAGNVLTVTVTQSAGIGTHADWNISLSGPPGAQGLAGDPHAFDSRSAATAASIPNTVNFLRTAGFAAAGDGGGALYIRAVGSTTGGFQSADGAWWAIADLNSFQAEAFGAKGDGSNDIGGILNNLAVLAAGAEIRLGIGLFKIATAVAYATAVNFGPALRLRGAGSALTTIDNQVPGGQPCISISGGASAFAQDGLVSGIKFKTTTGAGGPAIDLKAVYRFLCEDVWVTGLAANGVTITNLLGDADASNIVLFKRCFFINNGGAGLLHNFAAGVVQTSFVRCEDTFFQGNGLCGWYFIGLSGSMQNCAFTENGAGVGGTGGLWIVNNAASNAQFSATNCSFENNYVNSVDIGSLQGGEFIGCEIAGGTPGIVSTAGFNIGAATNLRIEGTRVRIGAALSPYTAFKLGSGCTTSVISNTYWYIFDAAGQVRYSVDPAAYANRLSDSFDSIQNGTDAGVANIACVNGANHDVALPLGGAGFGIAGPSAGFSVGGLTNGFDGRRLTLINDSGQTLTVTHEDPSSTAANRISCAGAVNLTVSNLGAVTLLYRSAHARWTVTGHS